MADDIHSEAAYDRIRHDRWLWEAGRAGADGTSALIIPGDLRRPIAPRHLPSQHTGIFKRLPADRFIDHGTTEHGSNAEMRWEAHSAHDYVTDNASFFVRSQSTTPLVNLSQWRLQVHGSAVKRPLDITYEQLLAMPHISVIRSLECAGNGRSYFAQTHPQMPEGTPWKLGAVGVAEWTGVPLYEILQRVGLTPRACDVMVEGLDEAHVRRPIPLSKALANDTLLAVAMNGRPLPVDHGFPLRLIVSGWAAVASIKWVGRIEISDQPLFSPWNTDSYVLIGEGYAPDYPAMGRVITQQSTKSAVQLSDPAELVSGPQRITGRSWSGRGRIARVEYSFDGGAWSAARLKGPNLPIAWCRWELDWDAEPGTHELRIRAADEYGNRQPERVPWNERGYLYDAVVTHRINVR